MLAHLLFAAALSAPAQDQGLVAYIVKQGSSRSVVSYTMLQDVYEEPGDFVWARYDGVDYVIHDAATIEQFAKLQSSVPVISGKKRELKHEIRAAERERLRTRSIAAQTALDDKVHALERQFDQLQEEHRNARNAVVSKLALLVDSAIREGLAVKVHR